MDDVLLVSLGIRYDKGNSYGPFSGQVACVGAYVNQDAMGGGLSGGCSRQFSVSICVERQRPVLTLSILSSNQIFGILLNFRGQIKGEVVGK